MSGREKKVENSARVGGCSWAERAQPRPAPRTSPWEKPPQAARLWGSS